MDRYARQTRLAEVGSAGQARLAAARVDVRLEGLAAEVAVRYLAGAGVGRLRLRERALGEAARSVNPGVTVEVDGLPPASPSGEQPVDGFDLRDPAAREVAAGAAAALRSVRDVLGAAVPEGA